MPINIYSLIFEGMFYLSCPHPSPSLFGVMRRPFKFCKLLEAFARLLETIFLIVLLKLFFSCFLLCSVHLSFRLIWIALSFNSAHLEGSPVLATSSSDSFYLYFSDFVHPVVCFCGKQTRTCGQDGSRGWFMSRAVPYYSALAFRQVKRTRSRCLGLLDVTLF